MYTKKHFSVELVGTIYGDLWWGGEAWKDVRRYAKADDTLRDLALEVTNCGDFQGSNLTVDSFVRVALRKGSKTTIRTFGIDLFPSVADCVGEKDSIDFMPDDL